MEAGGPGRYAKAKAVQPQDSLTYKVCRPPRPAGASGREDFDAAGRFRAANGVRGGILGPWLPHRERCRGIFPGRSSVGAIPLASAPGDSRLRSGIAGTVPRPRRPSLSCTSRPLTRECCPDAVSRIWISISTSAACASTANVWRPFRCPRTQFDICGSASGLRKLIIRSGKSTFPFRWRPTP